MASSWEPIRQIANELIENRAELEQRFLTPLRTGRAHDREIERTVGAFLENVMRIEDTARLLALDPNTLRQRLRRAGRRRPAEPARPVRHLVGAAAARLRLRLAGGLSFIA